MISCVVTHFLLTNSLDSNQITHHDDDGDCMCDDRAQGVSPAKPRPRRIVQYGITRSRLVMGSLPVGHFLAEEDFRRFLDRCCPPDTRCGWCGRVGASYIPDGIDPPVPLCGHGGINNDGCLFGSRDRLQVKVDALCAIYGLRPPYDGARLAFLQEVAKFL